MINAGIDILLSRATYNFNDAWLHQKKVTAWPLIENGGKK